MERTTNRKVGKYEVIGKVAQGGMGALYKARHPTLNRIVLLKRLDLRGVGGAVERFRREARLMMDFKNDHIVQVHDHFKEGSHYYIVEEYVDGISLDELIRRERYLSADAATLIRSPPGPTLNRPRENPGRPGWYLLASLARPRTH